MPQRCTICDSPHRTAIDRALVAAQEGNRKIAAQFQVDEHAVRRHAGTHLPQRLLKAHEAAEVSQADKLLEEVKGLRAKAIALLLKAEKVGDYRTALAGIREARGCLELLAKLQGQLDERPQINVLVAPEWLLVRAAVVDALRPWPEARLAVAAQLRTLGSDRAN